MKIILNRVPKYPLSEMGEAASICYDSVVNTHEKAVKIGKSCYLSYKGYAVKVALLTFDGTV